jgi:hypothetical protein
VDALLVVSTGHYVVQHTRYVQAERARHAAA